MVGFSFDDYPDESAGGFDFDAFPDEGEEKADPLMSGIRKGLQGATAGLSDEAAGIVEGAGRALGVEGAGAGPIGDMKLSDEGPTLDWEILRDAYKKARDKERGALKKDAKDNPVVSAVAEIGGAIASPINKLMPGASMAKSGAVLGGITGLGNSEADNLGDMALDTGKGVALGGALGYAADKASPYLEKGVKAVGEGSRNLAKRFGARALGAERGTIKKLGADKVDELGAYALDEGLLSPLASTDDVIARNAARQAEGAAKMNEVYSAIDDAGASTFNPLDVAGKVDESIGGFYRSPINRGETNQLENTLESILMRGDGNIPLKEAQVLKQELGKVANWKNNLNISEKERMAREAYGLVSGAIDDAAETGAKAIGKEGLEEILKQGKKLYGNSKGAEELLTNKFAREQGNKLFGLTDTIAGTGAVSTMGPAGLGVLAAKSAAERFGAQNAALGLNKVSKMLLKSPKMLDLYQKNPQAFQSLVQKLESHSNVIQLPRAADKDNGAMNFNDSNSKDALLQKTQGSQYAQVLQNAANNGDQSLSAAHYVLSQRDPNYRKLIEGGK